MQFKFTKKLLQEWDGRLVLLSYSGKGIVVYDFTITPSTTAEEIAQEVKECIMLYSAAHTITLDWKEFVENGPDDSIIWKPGKYLFEGGGD